VISSDVPLSEFIEIRGRFKRSIHLEKDYVGSSQNGDYIVTTTARGALRRLLEGIKGSSPCRAWTLTGPYGTGKSAFAVFLTRLLCSSGKQSDQAHLQLRDADPQLSASLRKVGLSVSEAKGFFPILATARRVPPSRCLLESVLAAVSSARDAKLRASVSEIADLLRSQQNGQPWDSRNVVNAIASVSDAAKHAGHAGVLFIVDELGKLFEYTARYPQKSDIFVLQELAEYAAHSGGSPLLFIGLLHQSFEEYGQHLDLATRREWAKIQGRFEDIAFLEPSDQVIRMIAMAIRQASKRERCIPAEFLNEISAAATKAGVQPPGMQSADFELAARSAYPLHPATLVALPFVFRRFAQNERSLFSYLSSLEPYGFQEFIQTRALTLSAPPMIRLGDLFDYFTRNFGAGLYRHPHALRWLEAIDILEKKDRLTPIHREVVKTIGVLNALGEFCHLGATEEMISFAVSDSPSARHDVQQALKSLRDESIVTYRKFNRTFRIWEGSDVDIEERIAEGERKIRHGLHLADSLKQYLSSRPMVARRHSFETGALRYFLVEYVDNSEQLAASLAVPQDADGKVLVCLAESQRAADRFLEQATQFGKSRNVLFAIPQLIGELRAIVTELGALRWAWENTPELRDDRVARREMSLRIGEVNQLLQRGLDGLLDPREEPVGCSCLWIHSGRQIRVSSPVEVSHLLSDVCDRTYNNSPRIRNELIVRRSLSSAAAAARRNLIEHMMTHHAEEALGIVGYPPERSMYESVLRATELHRKGENCTWGFCEPGRNDPAGMLPSWRYLCDSIFIHQPEPIPLERLFSELAAPPYGILPGLHPVLLCAFILAHPEETTLYREGAFVPEPSVADFEVMMRRPELFAVAGSRITGGRAPVVQRLAKSLGVNAKTVPVVRALFRMVKALPEFAWNTKRLPEGTLALREVFNASKSPEQFLFTLLPRAMGQAGFSEQELNQDQLDSFFELLNSNLGSWAKATPNAIASARDSLLKACGWFPGESEWAGFRQQAVALEPSVTEPQLLAFVRRVAQATADSAGIESVLALVSSRPPRSWNDADVDRFPEAAKSMGRLFQGAVRSAASQDSPNSEIHRLSPKERREAEMVFEGVNQYLQRSVKKVSPKAVRAALLRLIEELES
jgi:hypothetical protein